MQPIATASSIRKRGILLGVCLLVSLLVCLFVCLFGLVNTGHATSTAMADNTLLAPGPYSIGSRRFTLVDDTRPTQANGDEPTKPERILKTRVWYPAAPRSLEFLRPSPTPIASHATPYPVIVYSHAFMSFNKGALYLVEQLVSYGYVVIAPNFPLTNRSAPGGPLVADVVNQPGDVTFLMDTLQAWNRDPANDFYGVLDEERIALAGLSLGAMTTIIATFHPDQRDSRIKAAVALAGPSSMFSDVFFRDSEIPFLMVAGTADALVEYEYNAKDLHERVPHSTLVVIEGGAHTSFSDFADPFFRWMENADSLGCSAIADSVPEENPDDEENFLRHLGGVEQGVLLDGARLPCQNLPLLPAIQPRRQHELTMLAVLSFLEGHLAEDPERQQAMQKYLWKDFPNAYEEISVSRRP